MSTFDCCCKCRDRKGSAHLLWLNVPGYIIFQVGWIKVQPHPVWLWIRFMLQWPWQYFWIRCWGKETPKLQCWFVCGKYLPCLKTCPKHTHSAHTHTEREDVGRYRCLHVCGHMCVFGAHAHVCMLCGGQRETSGAISQEPCKRARPTGQRQPHGSYCRCLSGAGMPSVSPHWSRGCWLCGITLPWAAFPALKMFK